MHMLGGSDVEILGTRGLANVCLNTAWFTWIYNYFTIYSWTDFTPLFSLYCLLDGILIY